MMKSYFYANNFNVTCRKFWIWYGPTRVTSMWWWWCGWWPWHNEIVCVLGGYGDRWDHRAEVSSACNWWRNVADRHVEEASTFRPQCTVFSRFNGTFFACFTSYCPDPDTNQSSSFWLNTDSRQFCCSGDWQARRGHNDCTLYKLAADSRQFGLNLYQ